MENVFRSATALTHAFGNVQTFVDSHLARGARIVGLSLARIDPLSVTIPAGNPTDVSAITKAIGTIQTYVVSIATALVVLMIIVAGVFIIIDRDVSTTKRGERLAFIRSILIGYAIVLGANFLVGLLISVMSGISSSPVTGPSIPASGQ